MKLIAIIQLRGLINVKKEVKDTLKMLNLGRTGNLSLIDDRKEYAGMLQKVKDYTTFGEIDEETLVLLLKNRGEVKGGKKLTEDYLKNNSQFKTIKEFAEKLVKNEAKLTDVKGLKKTFRLSPPKGGFKSLKKSFGNAGDLGNRKKLINTLIKKMVRGKQR